MKPAVVLTLAFVLLLLMVAPAYAGPPDIVTGTFTLDYEPIPGICPDFPVYQLEVGTYREAYFYDNQGNLIRMKGHYAATDEWYNYNDPTKRLIGPLNASIEVDFVTGETTAQGVLTGVRVPGYGTVLMWAGRLVSSPGGRFVGKYSPADPKDREQFCALLASD